MNSFLKKICYALFRLFPVNKDLVLFFGYYGEQYSGSPKYISQYLTAHSEKQIVWAFADPSKHAHFEGKAVRYGKPTYYKALATAGTIITNYRMTAEFKKRPNQLYLQTWHSSLRLKQIEKDVERSLPANYVKMAKNDSKQLDILLSGSKKSSEIFRQAFWFDGRIEPTGTPQCDILVNGDSQISNKIREHYGLPADAKILLYAPTFRKNNDFSVYRFDAAALLGSFEIKFGGTWYLLVRLHPHLANKKDFVTYSERVLEATSYDDVQELLCAADALMTDYSAIMFDFALTRRPCFLFIKDLENYISKDRKLYFDIRDLPFASFGTEESLNEGVLNFDEKEHQASVETFMREIGSFEDGRACNRVCELIGA